MRQVICKKDICELLPKHSTEQEGGGLVDDDMNYPVSFRSNPKSKKRGPHRKNSEQKGAGFASRWSSEEPPHKKGRKKRTKKTPKRRKKTSKGSTSKSRARSTSQKTSKRKTRKPKR